MKLDEFEICCPVCKGELHKKGNEELFCASCEKQYPIILGIPDFRVFPDPYVPPEADYAKGRELFEQFGESDFPGLVDYYYRTTPVVTPFQAAIFKKGLLAAEDRSEALLDEWEKNNLLNRDGRDGLVLELGCGSGPMLKALAIKNYRVIGLDISFRWLVMAKKRLADAGLSVPLVCACAEALPFPGNYFGQITGESILENVRDLEDVLTECNRVLNPDGRLCISAPNRFSIGPDPQTSLWLGGWLPEKWTAAYVLKKGGKAPQRRLVSVFSLRKYLRAAGFRVRTVGLPKISSAQKLLQSGLLRCLIAAYNSVQKFVLFRVLLYLIGPSFYIISTKSKHNLI